VYPSKSPTGLDIPFEGVFLVLVEYISGGAEEDHGGIPLQIRFIEYGGFFRCFCQYAIFGAEVLDCFDGDWNAGVPESSGFTEDQDSWRDIVSGLIAANSEGQQEAVENRCKFWHIDKRKQNLRVCGAKIKKTLFLDIRNSVFCNGNWWS
jgi:hypothetical protein